MTSFVRPYGLVAESGKSSETGTDAGSPYTVADDEKTRFWPDDARSGPNTMATRGAGDSVAVGAVRVAAASHRGRRAPLGLAHGEAHLAAVPAHHLEQRDRPAYVVLEVEQRQPDRLAHGLKPGKVDDGVEGVGRKECLERVLVEQVELGEGGAVPGAREARGSAGETAARVAPPTNACAHPTI